MWRSLFLFLAGRGLVRHIMTSSRLAGRVALRFVAGETLDEAVAVARQLNERGASTEIDYLGENVTESRQAEEAVASYLELLDRLAKAGADAHVSLKLTQMGLDLGVDVCRRNLLRVVERAADLGNFVWIDMESSAYTERTLQIYGQIRSEHANVGVVIQAYLRRSKSDVQEILSMGGTVRLCKGAYMEPPHLAFVDKKKVDENFAVLAEMLLSSRRFHAIATHDEKLIRRAIEFALNHEIDNQGYEFQLLYGVRRDLQGQLLREGRRVRVYVPYGSQWYPYFMRRLAERPANLLFLLSNLLREVRPGGEPRRGEFPNRGG